MTFPIKRHQISAPFSNDKNSALCYANSRLGGISMPYKQNLHTHSTYCDGADTPEQTVQTAIEKGFDSIGFSGHCYMYYVPQHPMTLEGTEEYKKEVTALKEKYAGQINIFLGLEFDIYADIDKSGYDYMIGSVHYLRKDGKIVDFDKTQDVMARIIREDFDGDGMAFAKLYYETVAQLPNYGNFDILGHCDLIAKHCERTEFFDRSSREYRHAAIEALEAVAGKIPYFEVNTGAISRGYRTTPYPDPFLLDEMKRLGFGAVVTSDCHNRQYLDCAYEQAWQLLRDHGFREQYILTKDGFVPMPL